MSASSAPWRQVATFSHGVAAIPFVESLIGCERLVESPGDARAREIDAVIGWGQKDNTRVAVEFARRHGLPYWRAEDGFLRSVGLGAEGAPPLSVALDDRGIYYDARSPSRLESICASDPLSDPELLARAEAAMARLRAHRLSKYNDSPPSEERLPRTANKRVLVVDQTAGDLSVTCGLADSTSFHRMLSAALADHPTAEIVVKTHPDVVAGKKRGFLERPAGHPRVRVVATRFNPIALLEQVDHVYVVTSQLGFEALVMGLPVTCFGVPFYAGWGLTDDRAVVRRRGRTLSIAQLFAAAYILYPRYIDPDTGEPCEIERVLDHLVLQRQMFRRNRGTIFCFGFRFWKQNYVRAYLRCPGNRVLFPRSVAHARWLGFDHTSTLLVWGQRETAEVRELARRHGVAVWRMEDGFLRSVGLGSDLVTPASLVVDRRGIYYDPSRPSELETILGSADFSESELARAAGLREAMVEARISKYNVGRDLRLDVRSDRAVILVPGQVEDDASILLGCLRVRTNADLLADVRRRNPDAYIIFKPHPDVLSGNRRGALSDSAAALADHVEREASLPACLEVATEVHTMTSLVGFEGLLRRLRVVVYGQPFYAGWGLTEDHNPPARRVRRLQLDELVAGTLIRYPRYLNRETGQFTNPEVIIRELGQQRDRTDGASSLTTSWSRRQMRKLVHVYREVTNAR